MIGYGVGGGGWAPPRTDVMGEADAPRLPPDLPLARAPRATGPDVRKRGSALNPPSKLHFDASQTERSIRTVPLVLRFEA